MPNLPLAFAEILAGGILLVAGSTGNSPRQVMSGITSTQPWVPDGGGSSSSTSAAGVVSTTGAGGSYTNPFPGATASRVDQGVDYTGKTFLAPGNSKILVADQISSGWRGGGYIAGQLLDGPQAGKVWYMAEGIAPSVQPGQTVNAGTPVGKPVSNPYNMIVGNIEAGWANITSPRQPLAQATGGYSEGVTTAAGASFNRFVQALGGPLGKLETAVRGSVQGIGLP